jgi:hypothetical protein
MLVPSQLLMRSGVFEVYIYIRALSAHSATEFNISPGRWTAIWPVASVSTERWGKMERNDWYTACGNFKTLIALPQDVKNRACSFPL